jgi:hypothetical protein
MNANSFHVSSIYFSFSNLSKEKTFSCKIKMKEQLKIKRVFESGKRGRGRPRKGFLYSFPFPIKVKRQPGQRLKFIVTPKERPKEESVEENESEARIVNNNSTSVSTYLNHYSLSY